MIWKQTFTDVAFSGWSALGFWCWMRDSQKGSWKCLFEVIGRNKHDLWEDWRRPDLGGHHALFSVHVLSPQGFSSVQSRFLSALRTPNSQNHSYLHYSLSKFMGERNHIHILTPITRIVATKFEISDASQADLSAHALPYQPPRL